MKYAILGIIALMFLKAGWNWFQTWQASKKNDSTSPSLGLLDWNNTAPGKYLGEVIPVDLVNWVMWPVALILAFLVVRYIYRTVKGGGAAGGSGSGAFIGFITIITLLTAAWTIGYKWSGNTAPVVADLVFHDKMTIEVPLEPQRIEIKVSLPAPVREMYNTPRNFYYCAKPIAPALEGALGPVNGLQELPYGNPRSYEKKVELHPILRHLAEMNSMKAVKLRIWRIERRWDERPNCS